MTAALLFLASVAAIYALSQGVTGIQADAPGHCGCATGEGGMKLSFAELVTLAQNAGFDTDSQTAAAIALAESGGDTTAYNSEPQDVPGRYDRTGADDGLGSYGLWQIYLAAHPEYQDGRDMSNGAVNASAAFDVYSAAHGFHPWSTFKNGKYQEYMNA